MFKDLTFFSAKAHRWLAGQLPYLPRTLTLIWDAAGYWTVAWIALLAVQGILPAVTVQLTRVFVDSLIALLESDQNTEALARILALALVVGIVYLLAEVLRGAVGWINTVQTELVQDHINELIHRQSASVDFAFYETPAYFDQLHLARSEASYRPVALLENFGALFQHTVSLIAISLVLLPYGVWLPGALLLSTMPVLFIALRHRMRQHQWRLRVASDERRVWYFDWLLTSRDTAGELRLFDLGKPFRTVFQDIRRRLRTEHLQLVRGQALIELAAAVIALIFAGAVMLWMMQRAWDGQLTLGDLALFFQAFNQGQRVMRSLVRSLEQLYANSLFLGNLFEFLALEPQIDDPPTPQRPPEKLQEGIRCRDVRFAYPGTEKPVLENFNMFIPAGKIVAIVGANGSGKSTLLKLISRLYDPDAGSVTFDGVDVRDFSQLDLRSMLSVLFQEPVHYSSTARENITLDVLPETVQPNNTLTVEQAAQMAGADVPIGHLPDGYDALLGKWFKGGHELSIGEWKRIALARTFYRKTLIVLLDEPTSAMDPWAEANWLEGYRTLATNQTVILITHRFTTAMFADLVFVMEAGQIVESGTPQDLIAGDGSFSQLWQLQTNRPS